MASPSPASPAIAVAGLLADQVCRFRSYYYSRRWRVWGFRSEESEAETAEGYIAYQSFARHVVS